MGGQEGEIEESHDLAREIGPKGEVHAGMMMLTRCGGVAIAPGAADTVDALFIDDNRVALEEELPSRNETSGSRTDHTHRTLAP